MTILRELREGAFDALVGVNLLREGLDLPEVSMVCILDADKEGFLRSETSLIQTIGRSARHVNAEVVLYADKITDVDAAGHRRDRAPPDAAARVQRRARDHARDDRQGDPPRDRRGDPGARRSRGGRSGRDEATDASEEYLGALEAEMLEAAEKLEFERAAALRDKILELRSAAGGRPGAARRLAAGASRPARGQGQGPGWAPQALTKQNS